MFKDINLQDLAWIIVKSRPGLLYASLLMSQPSALHAITAGKRLAIFLVSGEKRSCQGKLQVCSSKPLSISSPGKAEIAKEVALTRRYYVSPTT